MFQNIDLLLHRLDLSLFGGDFLGRGLVSSFQLLKRLLRFARHRSVFEGQ